MNGVAERLQDAAKRMGRFETGFGGLILMKVARRSVTSRGSISHLDAFDVVCSYRRLQGFVDALRTPHCSRVDPD
jgi:hypothetical protein